MEVSYMLEFMSDEIENVIRVLDFWIEHHPKETLYEAHPMIMLYRKFAPVTPSNREEYP